MMKRVAIIAVMLLLIVCCQAQTYYNMKYTWQEIEGAVKAVRDTLPGTIAGKLDADVSRIELPRNPGVPIVFNFSIDESPLDTEHGYIFAIDSLSVLRIAAHTSDGDNADRYSVVVGNAAPDPDYALSIAGAAIASRWDVAGADFAEYFETAQPLQLGVSVVFGLDGKIRPAMLGELPFGVTSCGAGFVGNSNRPSLPYMTNALGDTLYQDVEYVLVEREARFPSKGMISSWVPRERVGAVSDSAEVTVRHEAIKNPDFGKEYFSYRNNPEMCLVGLVGQIPLRRGQPVHPNWFYIKDLDKDTQLWLVK